MAGRLLKVSSVATAVFASSGFYLYSKNLDLNDHSIIRFGRAAVTLHLRSAERLRDLCCANRGTFIKVGQHLGALDYLLPEEYTSTLKVLHSKAPQSSMEEIRLVIQEDLGKEFLVQVVHWLFPDFSFMWLVEEAKKNMPLELDFLNEGRNAEKLADMLKQFDFLKIPKIHWELSTKRILTMDFAEGGQVNDREYMRKHSINVNEISQNLGKMYSEMIFVHGFVHCDPHPGNVLVRKGPESNKTEIVLLDHGLYQDVEIRTNAALYLPQISELLNRVPRQMLLLLKTNDLLRGIETILQTRASSSSFINMSRCCTRAIARHQRGKTKSRSRRLQISLSERWALCQIGLYELMLWLRSSALARWVYYLIGCLPCPN
ncbi:putative aarF domain-containing protein kinase 1 [Triplophysa rosa]|uniref:AarF domain-containing protein kinase 1 n=1 Tax=Triplophysa rosa TaxID=992332 RepID=A0A9W7TXM4_TRIRA|nr:putative aarF domain-containing protein kinase 1 [Triplophysa rosa]